MTRHSLPQWGHNKVSAEKRRNQRSTAAAFVHSSPANDRMNNVHAYVSRRRIADSPQRRRFMLLLFVNHPWSGLHNMTAGRCRDDLHLVRMKYQEFFHSLAVSATAAFQPCDGGIALDRYRSSR